ncbi:hypothetical protein B0H14DRAFT_3488433 [Mycena olivaceomarginata]|nr:hypothetical protein B0H14DRAFT_3488433 [Mycena olivaceomarginata]
MLGSLQPWSLILRPISPDILWAVTLSAIEESGTSSLSLKPSVSQAAFPT